MINLLLIDQSVPDKDFIISNKLENTQYLQIDAIKQSFSDLYLQIEQLNITTPITNIGLIKVNDFRFFNLNTVNIEVNDPNLDHLEEFINFLNNLKNKFGMINFDIITCNLYNDDWKYIIDTVKNKHNITIRTSSNITGKYGDWLLESDGTSLVGLYFNEDINNYQYSLDVSFHTIIMDDSFNLWGCGSNTYGQLGLDNLTNTLTLMTAISGKTPIQVACGGNHTIVLMSDETIYGCGANGFGQLGIGNTLNTNTLTLMTGISGKTPIQVACRSNHTVVLMSDGSIYSCGYNIVGQLGTGNTTNTNTLTLMTGISGKTPIQVECGDSHTIVLMSDGSIYGCGSNNDGQLGTGNTTNTNRLTPMIGISGKTPIQVACGGYHTTVLMSDGTIYGCGYNIDGELGTGDTLDTNTLTLITGISGKTPIQVACGGYHTAVLMSDGSIYSCGYNYYGNLGTGDTLNTNTLTLMTGISGKTPIQVACGGYYTAVLMSDGSIYSCGYNIIGQLGSGNTTNTSTLTPINQIGGKTAIQVACGGNHTIVLMSDGTIYGCGYNAYGQLGLGYTSSTNTLTLMNGIIGKKPIQVACSSRYTAVLMSDGTIYGCGYNDSGQLGTGDNTSKNTLTQMTGISGKTPIQVACGGNHTIVLMSDGTIYGCGYNIDGELGTGDTLNTNRLTLMTGISGKTPIQVACGGYHTAVLMSDGSIYSCGYNYYGQLGTGDTSNTNRLTPMIMTGISGKTPIQAACGDVHTAVLMSDGTIYGCGYNIDGQLGIGNTTDTNTLTLMTGISGKTPIQVACGTYHTTVLMSDGSIYGCGSNNYGQLGTGNTTNTNTLTPMIGISGKTPIQVSCGIFHTTVLMSDGSIYSCGYNNVGQLGTGNTSNTDTLTAMIRPANMTTPILLQGHIYENNPISDICFIAGTPVNCDQGIIAIDKIDPKIHTIRGNEIIEVTKTITQDDYLVYIDKDAFNLNVPSQKTIMTQKHEVFYNGYMICSNDLLGKVENVYKVKYSGEILYNILLKNHSLIQVNNMLCETLKPNIDIVKMLLELKEQNIYQKQHFIRNFNESFTRSEIMAN